MRVLSANGPDGSRRKPLSTGSGDEAAAMRPNEVGVVGGMAFEGVRTTILGSVEHACGQEHYEDQQQLYERRCRPHDVGARRGRPRRKLTLLPTREPKPEPPGLSRPKENRLVVLQIRARRILANLESMS